MKYKQTQLSQRPWQIPDIYISQSTSCDECQWVIHYEISVLMLIKPRCA